MNGKNLYIAALSLALISCSQGGGNMSFAVGSPELDYTRDAAKFGLLGPVHTVSRADGVLWLSFSEDGVADDNDEPLTHFEGRVRCDIGYSGYSECEFDDLGRIVREYAAWGYLGLYFYEGNNYFPSHKHEEISEEEDIVPLQIVEIDYQYRPEDFDSHGNWLARTVNGEWERRSITYYE